MTTGVTSSVFFCATNQTRHPKTHLWIPPKSQDCKEFTSISSPHVNPVARKLYVIRAKNLAQMICGMQQTGGGR